MISRLTAALALAALLGATAASCDSRTVDQSPSPAVTPASSPSASPVPRRVPTCTATSCRATVATTRPAAPSRTVGENVDETEPATGADYANCDELHVDYPRGVTVTHPAYERRLDPNADGRACGASE